MDDVQLSSTSRTWGMWAHFSTLAWVVAPVVGNLLGPILIWAGYREKDPFVADQAKESLNFQLTMLLWSIIGAILTMVAIGIVLLLVIGILLIVYPIIAGIRASNGELYRYPMTIRFVT